MTIYDRIRSIHASNPDISEFSSLIDEQLGNDMISSFIKMFKTVYQFDISDCFNSFEGDEITFEEDAVDIVFTFKYGTASVGILNIDSEDEQFHAAFSFADDFPNHLYGDITPRIVIDANMNFQYAQFNRVFEYGTSILNPTIRSTDWAACIVNTLIDINGNKTHEFNYQSNNTYVFNENYIDNLFEKGLSDIFLSPSDDFDLLLFRYLQLNGYHPNEFYEVFSEKEDYLDIIKSPDNMVKRLNIFFEEYLNNKELLSSRLAVLEMRLI